MTTYGQFCSIARAHEVIGGRWTLLVVREILCGSRRFNDIRRGIPRISKTILSERLSELLLVGVVSKSATSHGPEYDLTEAGLELAPIVAALATWGQRRLPRHAASEDLDLEPLLVDMQRRVREGALPAEPLVARFEIKGSKTRFMLIRRGGTALCTHNPGFPEPITIKGALPALVGWWRGDIEFAATRRQGLVIEGSRHLVRAFPDWFERYQFAEVAPVRHRVRQSDPA